VSQQKSTLRNRLKDRISKNKIHISNLNKAIVISQKDVLELSDMKKLLIQGVVAPLMTFVDQVKNTTDTALLSMQRELASKEKEYEYVVYDRHVI
jgi:hypothetical protein